MSMEKLAAVESILGSSISAIDTKTEQEKLTLDAKNKAKKLFGDAKERKDAKKKEKKGVVETLKMFLIALKWSFIGQRDNHTDWDMPMSFASINHIFIVIDP